MSLEKNKRIAKNTMMLYIRMLLIMVVSLFTVRVVLNTLGDVDYGIYNVVGGIVVMFNFLSGTMSSASLRFFAFELGRKDYQKLKHIFNLTFLMYTVLAVLVLVVAQTVGLWFLNTQMNIPAERLSAANWVYQFSIFSFILTIMTLPYNAIIIARENMKVFAYVSIVEALLRLLIVYLLLLFPVDKLKLYSVLMFSVVCIVTFIYRTICSRNYPECKLSFFWDKDQFKTLISFSGWNMFGALSGMLKNQGLNILLNLFFGPVVNAARGIAYQLSARINEFVMNFSRAINPQITKYYAANEKNNMHNLVFRGSKFAYFLLFFVSMPLVLETSFILTLWLGNLPEYTILFTRLIIALALVDSLSYALMTAAQATGKIRNYQIVVGSILLLNIPASYVLLRAGHPPQVTMYVAITTATICLILRVYMLQRMIDLSFWGFMRSVILSVITVSGLAYIPPIAVMSFMPNGFLRFLMVCISGGTSSLITIYFLGFSSKERTFLTVMVKNKLLKRSKPQSKRESVSVKS
ncbi:oligosaccharide flippase family protein [Chitinispirillales bacterium ANBcel5]|uniref:lipopolysaccharide biosynthesis protein n=1 Tax=Cellulosispirillum alkaliphilum TaxID=3039283 RepID=UPI002A53ADE9|nr:oligosaccharide flippase family protein [Chitinispirillales bacterium ANBcel5]